MERLKLVVLAVFLDRDSAGIKPWYIASLVLWLCLLAALMRGLTPAIVHDCAMFLHCGQLILDGKVPYVDLIDLNPPLVYYLNVVPAWIARVLSQPVVTTFNICVWLFSFSSWALCARMLSCAKDHRDRHLFGPLLLSMTCFSIYICFWGDFGQRQYLAALGVACFTITRWLRYQSIPVPALAACGAGIIFGASIALVPQYVLAPMASEATMAILKRKPVRLLSPETLSVIGVGIIYAASFAFLPDSAQDYFRTRLIPLIKAGYGSCDTSLQSLFLFPFITGCVPMFLLAIAIAIRCRNSLSAPLIAWWVAAFAVAIVQHKGWFNHYIPAFVASFIFCSVQLQAALTASKVAFLQHELLKLAVVLLVISGSTVTALYLKKDQAKDEPLKTILQHTSPQDNVMMLVPVIPDAYPHLLMSGRGIGSRYLWQFPILFLEQAKPFGIRDGFDPQKEERLVVKEIKTDIEKLHPKLVFIATNFRVNPDRWVGYSYFENNGIISVLKKEGYECIGNRSCYHSDAIVWKAAR